MGVGLHLKAEALSFTQPLGLVKNCHQHYSSCLKSDTCTSLTAISHISLGMGKHEHVALKRKDSAKKHLIVLVFATTIMASPLTEN